MLHGLPPDIGEYYISDLVASRNVDRFEVGGLRHEVGQLGGRWARLDELVGGKTVEPGFQYKNIRPLKNVCQAHFELHSILLSKFEVAKLCKKQLNLWLSK